MSQKISNSGKRSNFVVVAHHLGGRSVLELRGGKKPNGYAPLFDEECECCGDFISHPVDSFHGGAVELLGFIKESGLDLKETWLFEDTEREIKMLLKNKTRQQILDEKMDEEYEIQALLEKGCRTLLFR